MDEKKKNSKVAETTSVEELEVKIFEAEFENIETLSVNYGSVLQCTECC
ncbi:hypothetical protein PV797_10780 [Clostridiaceae bacterium M8S5]|nr:hypothetical protein PV797_10780 [Clostridiaceae bacterium M8S5]